MRHQQLDSAFPTVVRYIGIGLIVFWAIGRSIGLDVPESLLVAAAGMIGFKAVHKGGGNNDVKP
jgi:hypothetical protein